MSLELFQLAKGFGFSYPQYEEVEAHKLDQTLFNGMKCCYVLFFFFFVRAILCGELGEIAGRRGICHFVMNYCCLFPGLMHSLGFFMLYLKYIDVLQRPDQCQSLLLPHLFCCSSCSDLK